MPGWVLKATACLVTGLATLASAVYVGGHLKSTNAPLHPTVVASTPATGGHLNLSPSIRSSDDQQPITFTSVS